MFSLVLLLFLYSYIFLHVDSVVLSFDLMTRCWEEVPQSRPSFSSLVVSVGDMLPDDYKKVSHLLFFFHLLLLTVCSSNV